MDVLELLRLEDTLILNAQDVKLVIEWYCEMCIRDPKPSGAVIRTDRLAECIRKALPEEPEPDERAIVRLITELPKGRYPSLVVDAETIPVWRRKCLLENLRHRLKDSGDFSLAVAYGDARGIAPLARVALTAFLGVPDVLDRAVRFVNDLYPYDLVLTDEKLGIHDAYKAYPDTLRKTEHFEESDWLNVRNLLAHLWRTRLEGLYIERAMGALGSDESQWVDISDSDEAVADSVGVMALAHELLVAGRAIGCDENLASEEAAAQLTACCNSAGEGLVALGLTPSYFDPSIGAWRR